MYTYKFLTTTLLCEGGDAMVPPLLAASAASAAASAASAADGIEAFKRSNSLQDSPNKDVA